MSPFTIIEIRLDEANNDLSRRPAWARPTREEAIKILNDLMSRYSPSGYDADGDFWWGTAVNGDRMKFLIEASAEF
jgi:hypothetical protein